MNIDVINSQEDLPLDGQSVQRLVIEVIRGEGERANEVGLYFVSEDEISDLHAQFFNDPTVTDCISFPLDGPEEARRHLGEVFVCPKVAMRYVEEHGGDPHTETSLYVVHGILHLLGYDDIDEEDQRMMRAAERRHIEALTQKDLLLRCP